VEHDSIQANTPKAQSRDGRTDRHGCDRQAERSPTRDHSRQACLPFAWLAQRIVQNDVFAPDLPLRILSAEAEAEANEMTIEFVCRLSAMFYTRKVNAALRVAPAFHSGFAVIDDFIEDKHLRLMSGVTP
jgi:hypothetical protein